MFKVLTATEGLPYEDWLALRRLGIGGSDASVVCGINKYKSPVELWMEKTGQLPHREAGEAAYWGTRLEDLVRAEFTKRTGIEVNPVNHMLQSEMHPYMLANLDGTCEHPDYGPCVFEAKTAGAYLVGEWDDAIPDNYLLQVMHYMAVTGYAGAYIAVLIGGNTFKYKFIERDEELIDMLIRLEGVFWRYVQERVPPPLDGSEASTKFISQRFPNSQPHTKIDLPDTAASLIAQYEEVTVHLALLTERKQEAENLLKQMLGENEIGAISERVITWKTVTQERLDTKAFKAKHPKLYNRFAHKTSHRRFSISSAG